MKIDDILNSKCGKLNQHLQQPVKKKKHKYGAEPVEIDGHKFPSKKEAGRYLKLRMMKAAKLIKKLRLQVRYELNEGGTHSVVYVADFVYIDCTTGLEVVEDAKGFKTREYKKKKRLMLQIQKIKIKEV
jgi:hypothetical protein